METILLQLTKTLMRSKIWVLPLLSSFLLVASMTLLKAQEIKSLPPEVKEAIDALSDYHLHGYDRLSFEFDQFGYHPPKHLTEKWKKWPVLRRIELAYKDYEAHSKGAGSHVLALLSQSLAQRYDGPKKEPVLKPFLELYKKLYFDKTLPILDSDREFQTLEGIKLTPEVKSAILAISDYTDSGVFSIKEVLSRHCELGDDAIYEILRTCETDNEALEQGLKQAAPLRSINERVTRIVDDYCEHYESPRYDDRLASWRSTKPSLKAQEIKPLSPEIKEAIAALSQYHIQGFDRLCHAFDHLGYHPPKHFTERWKKWPISRRIELAYNEYEAHSTGTGSHLLALMSQHSSQRAKGEPPLKLYQDLYSKLYFEKTLPPLDPNRRPISQEVVGLTPEVKAAILAISNYMDSGAIGIQEVLSHHCELGNDEIFEILRTCETDKEALEQGLKQTPPSHSINERLTSIVENYCEYYESARNDDKLSSWRIKNASKNKGIAIRKLTKTPEMKGHLLTTETFPIKYQENKRLFELVPDRKSASLLLVVDSVSAFSKNIPNDFFLEFHERIVGAIEASDSSALKVENEIRQKLKEMPQRKIPSPQDQLMPKKRANH